MALRHEYFDDNVYGVMLEAVGQALLKPQVVLCTVSLLQKLQGNLSAWSRKIKAVRKMVLLVDEYHQLGFESLLAALAAFDAVVLSGDEEQAPVQEWLTGRHHAEAT